MPAPTAGLGLEGQANQEEAEEESEEDEAPAAAADGLGAGATESDGRAQLQTSGVLGGAPAGRAASKKLERLGNKHGLELDDRLAELLRYGTDRSVVCCTVRNVCLNCLCAGSSIVGSCTSLVDWACLAVMWAVGF